MKRHGVALPLSALRTQNSAGIGEYLDLIPLIDWCASVGLTVIQLLPLNDSDTDPSPYSARSAYALHPIYCHLPDLSLPNSDRINYQAVLTAKKQRIADLADTIRSDHGFSDFCAANPWLDNYCAYAGQDLRPAQYLCHQQLLAVRRHADAQGVQLMGDIPILLSPNSADVAYHPEYFDTTRTVGAPPDQYSADGQDWGFPLYRWDAIEADDFSWWRQRLQCAQNYFHLYRIDHIVGLFRFWAIQKGAPRGHYHPTAIDEWLPQGKRLLEKLIASSTMVPIGEDLGDVPVQVRTTMRDLDVCGTKVMRWERHWDKPGQPFRKPEEYIPESLTCTSTHDSEPLKLWWKNQVEEAKAYADSQGWTYTPDLSYDHLYHLLRTSNTTSSRYAVNPLQDYLSLFDDLVRPDPALERVNTPGTLSEANWTYRFLPTIDDIAKHDRLGKTIKELIRHV